MGHITDDYRERVTAYEDNLLFRLGRNGGNKAPLYAEFPSGYEASDVQFGGLGLGFNGAASNGSYIDTGMTKDDFPLTGDITVMGWILPESAGGGNFSRVLSSQELELLVYGNVVNFRRDGISVASSATNSITYGLLYHIAITSTSTGVTNFYINGALSGTPNQDAGEPDPGATNIFIGNRSATDRTFDGTIYPGLEILSTILTPTQIADRYATEWKRFSR